MSDKATNAINAVIIGSVVSVSTVVNNLDPSKISEYPYYLLIYFYQFIHPPTDLLSSIFIAKLA
jgi:hypothetical protein